ncbi:MAG: TolC family protein [Saonia sp.]
MKMDQKKSIIVLLFFLACNGLVAQEKWTLEECVSYALDHNLGLKDFEYNEASNKESYRQSIRDLLPTVGGLTDYFLRFGRQEDPNTGIFVSSDFFENNYSLNSSIDLFRGFQKMNAIKASKFLYSATKEEVLQQKYLLAFRVMSAFYDIKFFEGLLINSKEQQEISQANYDLVNKQIDLGLMAGADLYEAESLLLADQLIVIQSENSLKAARLSLIQEMNLKGATTINIQPTLDELDSMENELMELRQDSIFNKAMGFIPIIKAQEWRTKAAKKDLAVARGNLYPSLSLSAGYRTRYLETSVDEDTGEILPFNVQATDNATRFIGVSLNIPISEGWSRRSAVKQQKIALQRAANNLEIQEQVLYQTIQQLIQEHNALQAEYEQGMQRMESQDLAFTIAQKRYEKGLINALELFTAKNLFASAQNANLQVRLRLEVNKSTLDFYRGLPVFNIN